MGLSAGRFQSNGSCIAMQQWLSAARRLRSYSVSDQALGPFYINPVDLL